MDLNRLTSKAKDVFKQRGGREAAEQDAQELRDIARSKGSTSQKAKDAFEAIQDPGKPGK